MEKGSFEGMESMTSLDLSHNYLDGLSEFSFEGCNFNGKLDLSFNLIKRLGMEFFALGLYSLKELDISNNDLNRVENFSFSHLKSLEKFYLDSNKLDRLDANLFLNLTNLKHLQIASNRLSNLNFLNHLFNLEYLDLSNNEIERVDEETFGSCLKITQINLNSNKIKYLHEMTFKGLLCLISFKISRNNLNVFNMNILNLEKILELDLSFNKIIISAASNNEKIESIILANVTLVQTNSSIETFINSKIRVLDFSNNFIKNFASFNIMSQIEWLAMSRVNLDEMRQIQFENFQILTHLDLSFNHLKSLEYDSFRHLENLIYLDLSFNRIEKIDSRIFDWGDHNKKIPLKYLNMESNYVIRFENRFLNFLNLELFKMSSNRLDELPNFQYWSDQWYSNTFEFYFNRNKIATLKSKQFTLATIGLKVLNFDFNQIATIEEDALLNLRNIENLSVAFNNLSRIEKHYFFHLFSLKHLNLSSNQIEFVEFDSFINLNKLFSLDLSYNLLRKIEPYLFSGLSNLNDLYLINDWKISLSELSFANLTKIGNFYLNESMTNEYKCIFAHAMQRDVQRVIKKRFSFFKSINLITQTNRDECELKLHLLQFKIHLNLKTDEENEIFYEKCQSLFSGQARKSNSFNNNLKKCFTNYSIDKIFNNYEEKEIMTNNVLSKIFSNPFLLVSIFLLMSLFGPVCFLIVLHFFETTF